MRMKLMKLTERKLRRIIREELNTLTENQNLYDLKLMGGEIDVLRRAAQEFTVHGSLHDKIKKMPRGGKTTNNSFLDKRGS